MNGLALALIALALALLWWRRRTYRTVFSVPARRDDSFACRAEHETVPVSVASDGLDVPAALAGRGGSAFLALTVQTTLAGRLADPFIEVRRGPLSFRQYFERGARGRRHLNLSPAFQAGGEALGARVALRGRLIRWRREAALTMFVQPSLDGAAVLALGAHADDAEIGAFGMYAGRRSWVATVTASEGGMANVAALAPSGRANEWYARLRVWDSLAIPQLGGVPREHCLNLAYPAGRLREMHARPDDAFTLACEETLPRAALRRQNARPEFQGGQRSCTWRELVDDLRRLLTAADPDLVVSPHPLIDGHPDHVFATVALEQAARDLPRADRSFLLYVVHRRDAAAYPFGPAASVVSFPPWTDGEWIADAIYSHPLPEATRLAKYFAVEANHDLRRYDTADGRTLRQALRAARREVGAWISGTGLPAGTFLRRAPRPNELYCVVSASSLAELVARALAG